MNCFLESLMSARRRAIAIGVGTLLFAPSVFAQTPSPIRIAMIEGLSGPIANTGEAVYRNLVWATERVNARGGVKLPGGNRLRLIERFDSKGQTEEALSARQMLFLNYSAVDPALTNEKCSYWHFRFDAHTDMRMSALMSVLREDKQLKHPYLIGQDYSFGQAVLREGRRQLAAQRPDVKIVGEELHPMARVKDFLPYATKIKASGAKAVLTGNWGNDLTLLVKAAREVGFDGTFYTSTATHWVLRRPWARPGSAK